MSTAPGVGRQKKLAGPPRILRGHQRAEVRRPPKWRKSAADDRWGPAAGVISGGRPRATADDHQLKNCDSQLPPTPADARGGPADDRRSTVGRAWAYGRPPKKLVGPLRLGPPTPAKFFCNFTCFWRPRRGLPNLKIGGCRRMPAKYSHLRGRPLTLAAVSF